MPPSVVSTEGGPLSFKICPKGKKVWEIFSWHLWWFSAVFSHSNLLSGPLWPHNFQVLQCRLWLFMWAANGVLMELTNEAPSLFMFYTSGTAGYSFPFRSLQTCYAINKDRGSKSSHIFWEEQIGNLLHIHIWSSTYWIKFSPRRSDRLPIWFVYRSQWAEEDSRMSQKTLQSQIMNQVNDFPLPVGILLIWQRRKPTAEFAAVGFVVPVQ